jgi:hypothetical protein
LKNTIENARRKPTQVGMTEVRKSKNTKCGEKCIYIYIYIYIYIEKTKGAIVGKTKAVDEY